MSGPLATVTALFGRELGRIGSAKVTVGGILALLVGLVVALVAARLVSRGAGRLLDRRGVARGTRDAIERLVRYGLSTVACLVVLSSAGVDLAAVLAASTVALVGIGLGFQRLAQDFLAGFVLLLDRSVSKGDLVRVGESVGTVEHVGARATRILTRDRVELIVPNSELTTSVVVNYSQPTSEFRMSVKFGVAYGTSPDLVRRVALDAARGSERVLESPPPEVFFEDFGDSALVFAVTAWVADPRQDRRTASEIRFALAKALAEAGIAIPFPQLDVHVRTPPALD